MVRAARAGAALRAVAREFGVALSTVQQWVSRAEGQRLDRVDFTERSRAPQDSGRTPADVEDAVLALRRELREQSALGEYGPVAIREALLNASLSVPSVRTIARILERRGALDGVRRVRRPAPPPGWYLPEVARRRAELDSLDAIVGLVIKGGIDVEVLTSVSLHGGLVGAWPASAVTARSTREALVEHWRAVGLPAFAQFDNDTRFQGPHQHRDAVGSVTRLCLALGVMPVFAPPRETGFQAAVESFNGRWQSKVWSRFHHASLAELQLRSRAYVEAHRSRSRPRIDHAPPRRPFPKRFEIDRALSGRIVYLRRTNALGAVSMLGHHFNVRASWPHRLVRAEVDLDDHRIRFFALRRRDPQLQPLLREISHRIPR